MILQIAHRGGTFKFGFVNFSHALLPIRDNFTLVLSYVHHENERANQSEDMK